MSIGLADNCRVIGCVITVFVCNSLFLYNVIHPQEKSHDKQVVTQEEAKKIAEQVEEIGGDQYIGYLKNLNDKNLNKNEKEQLWNKLKALYKENEEFRKRYIQLVDLCLKVILKPPNVEIKVDRSGWGWGNSLRLWGLNGEFLFTVFVPEIDNGGKLDWIKKVPVEETMLEFESIWGRDIFKYYENVRFEKTVNPMPKYLIKLMLKADSHNSFRVFVNKSNLLERSQKQRLITASKYIESKTKQSDNKDDSYNEIKNKIHDKLLYLLSSEVWWVHLYVAEYLTEETEMVDQEIMKKLKNTGNVYVQDVLKKIKNR